jgi:hypothetical protein
MGAGRSRGYRMAGPLRSLRVDGTRSGPPSLYYMSTAYLPARAPRTRVPLSRPSHRGARSVLRCITTTRIPPSPNPHTQSAPGRRPLALSSIPDNALVYAPAVSHHTKQNHTLRPTLTPRALTLRLRARKGTPTAASTASVSKPLSQQLGRDIARPLQIIN